MGRQGTVTRAAAVMAALAVGAAPAGASDAEGVPAGTPGTRGVMVVANGEGGTVALVDARSFGVLRQIDVVPDGREASFGEDPVHALAGQRIVEAAGGENYAQDIDLSPDGRTLYVSRGHRGDLAAFDIATGRLDWKLRIPGFRADHMTVSDDGRHLYVSALTEDEVEVVDTRLRRVVATLPSGQWPHDNHLSADGARLYNGSIGNIITPSEARAAAPTSPYQLTVFDTAKRTLLASHSFDRGIRPFVVTRDERRMYAQLSEYHGVIEFDLRKGRVVRRRDLPVDAGVTEDDYDFEAPHHGLALSHDEKTLCAAGRASDYVALVSTRTLAPTAIVDVPDAPSWAAVAPDGRHCFVANTRAGSLSAISFSRRREVARTAVGKGPKLIEPARLRASVVCAGSRAPACRPRLRLRRHCRRRGAARLRLTGETDAVRRVTFKVGRRVIGRDRAAPFGRTLRRGTFARLAGRRVAAIAEVTRGPAKRVRRSAVLRRCR